MYINKTHLSFLLFLFTLEIANAKDINSEWQLNSPLLVSSELPVGLGLGLPKTLSAHSVREGTFLMDISSVVKSNANDARRARESLVIDGETHNIEANIIYGFSEQWQLDLQFSYLKHTAGGLDGIIQKWHDLFGFSDGDRPLFPEDSFEFLYVTEQGERRSINPSSGLGDIRLGAGYSIKQNIVPNLMLRFGVHLPIGSASKLIGSDKADVDAGVYASGDSIGRWASLGWHHNLGMIVIGDDESFLIPTKSSAWFHSIGINWKFSPRWRLKGQLDSHSAFFESQINELGKTASQLSMGVTYKTKNWGVFEVFFSEDITVNRSADFSIGITSKFAF